MSECDLKFNDPVERRDHCANAHKFPKNFRFDNASHHAKGQPKNQMDVDESECPKKEAKNKKVQLNKNQKSKMFTVAAKNATSIDSDSNASRPNPLTSNTSASSLAFIPRQLQRSYTNALTQNQSNEKNVLETESMMDLVDSLPK